MKKRVVHMMVKMLLLVTATGYSPLLFAQVKVGNNPTVINRNAALEIESTTKGLLLPRLSLTSTTNAAPQSSFVQGMFIFNTATTADVTPGIYYCDGTKWIKVSSAGTGVPTNTSWNLGGNSATQPGDFLGTTDKAPLVIKTNNLERMRITEDGWIGIGTATPVAALQVKGQLVVDTLRQGNIATDSILVANPADGRVKMVSAASFGTASQRKNFTLVTTNGQTVFYTPAPITDINKISLYRNGVLLSCVMNDAGSVIAEVPCVAGDEVRIIQLL